MTARPRLPITTFDLPAAEFRRGYRSAVYFNRMVKIIREDEFIHNNGLMQVFQKNHATLCGIDEAIAILKVGGGHWKSEDKAHKLFDDYMDAKLKARAEPLNPEHAQSVVYYRNHLEQMWVSSFGEAFHVSALYDGDQIHPMEPVMHIEGDVSEFGHLESVYLGVLARATKVATNTAKVVAAAQGKEVLFFADRFDRWGNQGADGYAARTGGASGVATDAMSDWWGGTALGTMPHALIALSNGNIKRACRGFVNAYPNVPLIALVDFNNSCVIDSLHAADEFGDRLYGVRLDTSENMVDESIGSHLDRQYYYGTSYKPRTMGDFKPTGVNPALVENVRAALDYRGYSHVKIYVSGGFDPDKINMFEDLSLPTDGYAVGSSLLQGSNDYTADIVNPLAKKGRWFRENPRLEVVA